MHACRNSGLSRARRYAYLAHERRSSRALIGYPDDSEATSGEPVSAAEKKKPRKSENLRGFVTAFGGDGDRQINLQ